MDIDPSPPALSNKAPSTYIETSENPIVGLRLPMFLLRTLYSNPDLATTSPAIVLLTAHAAMLETGFDILLPTSTTTTTATPTTYTNDTMDGNAGTQNSLFKRCSITSMQHVRISPSVFRIAYTITDSDRLPSHDDTKTKDRIMNTQKKEECALTCSSMGNTVVVAVTGTTPPVQCVEVDSAAYMDIVTDASEFIASKMTQTIDTSMLCSADHLQVDPLTQDIILTTTTTAIRTPSALALRLHSATSLWNLLKNNIALPAYTSACLSRGTEPPAGLLTLPHPLRMHLFSMLDAMSLASLSCACAELRYSASLDELWEPIVQSTCDVSTIGGQQIIGTIGGMNGKREEEKQGKEKEEEKARSGTTLMVVPAYVARDVSQYGYKWVYAECYKLRRKEEKEKERMQREWEEERRRNRWRHPPHVPPFGPAPFYPGAAPRGFPGVWGGDYDRLPFLGGSSAIGSRIWTPSTARRGSSTRQLF